jgi:hypothetical protein
MSRYYSDYDSPDDIIDKYTSTALSSSDAVHRKTSTNSRSHGKAVETIEAFSSSPPINSTMNPHHRNSSTNSGYLSRAELFGRSSPDPSPITRPYSRGLERIQQHCSQDHLVHSGDLSPSPLTRSFQDHVQAFSKHRSTQSLYGEYTSAYSSQNLRSSPTLARNSISGLRRGSSSSMQEIKGSDYSPGPILKSEMSSRFPELGLSSRKESHSPVPQVDGGGQERSLAEHTLRNTLSTVSPRRRTDKSRSSSWTSKLFYPCAHASSGFSGLKASSLNTHNPNAPSVSENSFEDIWITSLQPEGDDLETQEELDFAKQPLAPYTGKASIYGDESGILNMDSLPELQSSHDRGNMLSALNRSSLKDTVNDMEASDLSVQSVSSPPAADLLDQRSTSARQQLSISAAITIFEQELHVTRQHLSFSAIKMTASQATLAPTASRSPQGLSIAGANAIIYGCVSLAAVRFMLIGLGEDVRTINLASDMAVALIAGLVLCVFAHLYDGYRVWNGVEKILQGLINLARSILQAFRTVLAKIDVAFWDGVGGVDDEFQQWRE